ncbi:hypothetical protein G7Y79_00075g099020 [Physcia stellaris]|nr:hypothetical protein G7Y79_00075g099020 [Physcia stellaris]
MTSFRNLWSKEEDSTLRREVAKQMNKGVWSEEENKRLREAVQVHGRRWVEVAKSIKTRNADQCAKRWLHFLDPGLDYSEWTGQEDEYLIAEVERNGRNWRKIVNEVLPGRSATDAKNRFNKLQRGKQSRKGSNDGEAYKSKRSKSPDLMAIDSEEVGTTEALCPVSSFEEMLADQQVYEADSTFILWRALIQSSGRDTLLSQEYPQKARVKDFQFAVDVQMHSIMIWSK